MRLVLWDVDGTLLRGDGASKRAFEASLVEVFGTAGDPDVPYDGKTDPQIVRELMRGAGFDDATIDARVDDVVVGYLRRLRESLGNGAGRFEALPGVADALDALEARADVVLGLLTGNVADGAALKLRSAGIDCARFRVNAFGCDAEHRPELPGVARRRGERLLGRPIAGGDVVVIGDTPADVACARPIGARAVAVASGRYDVATLAAERPTAVLADLRDTAMFVAAVTG